jgi:hypothetical protein
MDTTFLTSIIIATVAIVPGIWALINQANKDKNKARFDIARVSKDATLDLVAPMLQEVSRLQTRARALEAYVTDKEDKPVEISEQQVKNIWSMLYEKPVIVRCKHCGSSNVITNLECIKCGAPIGG